ncbi:hypothetical protein [Staphylococcus saprophyticus]|uniref:hypothetical protein n=1 Tax=Staphylococcus saprophyticus TaxID=29385 RepID=UPI0038514B55
MNNKGNRCPDCQSNNTVIDKIPGEEVAHLFICDSCGHFHNVYICSKQGEK